MENLYNRPEPLLNIPARDLVRQLYPKYSMVPPHVMDLTVSASIDYYKNNPEPDDGVVVECGVWRGGVSVLLAKLFPEKKLFLCDSFKGFEPIGYSPHSLPKASDPEGFFCGQERHFEKRPPVEFEMNTHPWEISEEEVIGSALKDFNLIPNQHGIELISGYIRDSLPKRIDDLKKISVLRIDLDAYAATYECLEILYDNVIKNGIIIFDDYSVVDEASLAIETFQKNKNITFNFLPKKCSGCYIVKTC